MSLLLAQALGLIYSVSEIGLSVAKRARSGPSQLADRGSLGLLWTVILLSVLGGYSLAGARPIGSFGDAAPAARVAGAAFFVAGLTLRWYAIIYLGRFFTVNVAIAADHSLIDGGPYRFVRHPSYTGALMAFFGLGLTLGNFASLAVLSLPTCAVFLWRIRVEEAALLKGLGPTYRDYMRRTKRLIPAIY